MKPALLLLALVLAGPPATGQRPDTTKTPPRRPAAAPAARQPTAERGKPDRGAKPTGEPVLKRRKPPGGGAG